MTISATTLNDMILDAGTVTINAIDVGATVGGSSFTVTQEVYFPELDGVRGAAKGTGKVIGETATISVNMAEVTVANLARILPTVSSDSDATSEYTKLETFGYIGATPHLDVVWAGETMNGDAIEITLQDALSQGGTEMGFTDDGEVVYAVTFQAYYDLTAPKERCWQIMTEI